MSEIVRGFLKHKGAKNREKTRIKNKVADSYVALIKTMLDKMEWYHSFEIRNPVDDSEIIISKELARKPGLFGEKWSMPGYLFNMWKSISNGRYNSKKIGISLDDLEKSKHYEKVTKEDVLDTYQKIEHLLEENKKQTKNYRSKTMYEILNQKA
ncbi:MAG: hypothetical protein JW700_00715 [Candidatus Aenigmarchaeota archaeon]|nr:hypothetical protein [Candidatus Aenigmarchaeota archaeon]